MKVAVRNTARAESFAPIDVRHLGAGSSAAMRHVSRSVAICPCSYSTSSERNDDGMRIELFGAEAPDEDDRSEAVFAMSDSPSAEV